MSDDAPGAYSITCLGTPAYTWGNTGFVLALLLLAPPPSVHPPCRHPVAEPQMVPPPPPSHPTWPPAPPSSSPPSLPGAPLKRGAPPGGAHKLWRWTRSKAGTAVPACQRDPPFAASSQGPTLCLPGPPSGSGLVSSPPSSLVVNRPPGRRDWPLWSLGPGAHLLLRPEEGSPED